MPDYQIFGDVLRSELALPGLARAVAGSPRWILTRATDALGVSTAPVLGSEQVAPGVTVSLEDANGTVRLVFDDTGTFDISADGRTIRWHAPATVDLEAVRKDVLGRVIAVCLQQQNVIALHGSAVRVDDVAVAFLAPKYHGKSTTAAALIDRGATLLADDLVAITNCTTPQVLPSVPTVNLWRDSARRLTPGAGIPAFSADSPPSPKLQVPSACEGNPVPLAGIYLLAPFRVEPGRVVQRSRLGGVEAALALLGQAKIGALIGVKRRIQMLEALDELSARVPVYRLEVPRDFDRLSELTGAIWEWHGEHSEYGMYASAR